MPNDVTLGEVSRKLDDLAEDVRGLRTQLGASPTWRDIQHIEEKLEAQVTDLASRVAVLYDWKNWTVRVILGAVISAVLAAYFIIKP